MDKQLLSVSTGGHARVRPVGAAPGEEKYGFLYALVAGGAVTSAMIYSGLAGLSWARSFMVAAGAVIIGWGVLFSVLEMRRTTRGPKVSGEVENAYPARTLTVQPPTGDPYPHHEDYTESQGFDQGQLTSSLPNETPLVGRFLK